MFGFEDIQTSFIKQRNKQIRTSRLSLAKNQDYETALWKNGDYTTRCTQPLKKQDYQIQEILHKFWKANDF